MLKIYPIQEKREYLEEVAQLTQKQWGTKCTSKAEYQKKIQKKIENMISLFDTPYYCKLILLEDTKLVGFISLFESDSKERKDLTPWYATMFVKKAYRGNGYSKILHNAILQEAQRRGFKRIYLKTDLINYYEKFGAIYLDTLKTGEKLYYFDLEKF